MEQEIELTEGEEFIEQFFIDEGIRYKPYVTITNLKGDSKSHRVADFYLPHYDVYVEFFGRYNVSKEERARYHEKKRVYDINDIPCVYLYPENLGILKYVFNYRLEETLEEFEKKKQLLRFKFVQWNQQSALAFYIVLIGGGYLLNVYFSDVLIAIYLKAIFHLILILVVVLGIIELVYNTYVHFFRRRLFEKKPDGNT